MDSPCDLRTLRVLVIEDNAFTLNITRGFLTKLRVKAVSLAANGREALDILQNDRTPIDLALCDLQMPDMDGIELVRRAAVLPSPPAFAFFTSEHNAMLATVADLASAQGIAVAGTASKPVSFSTLQAIIERYSHTHRNATKSVPAFNPSRSELHAAIRRGELLLHYQPKVDLRSNLTVGLESLIRWRHPVLGLVGPGAFVNEAERLGVIVPMTDWIITEAFRQCAAWNAMGLRTTVSVNLSPRALENLALPDRLLNCAELLGVDPAQIVFEVTESGLFTDTPRGLEILARLHLKGFKLSIDDFGTGYSSMDQLRRLPVTELKIDRAFVHDCTHNLRVRAILESSAILARALGMRTVAEGAEREEDVATLRALGIDAVQGFYFSKPVPPEQATEWLRSESTRTIRTYVG